MLPRTLQIDTRTARSVVHLGSIQLSLQPEPDPVPASAGWPEGSHLSCAPPVSPPPSFPDADERGWVISRSDDPEVPTLVALAPTVPTLHRELAHRVWHRAVDLLVDAGDAPLDPFAVAAAVHEDLTTALARGWRLQVPWVPAIVEGRRNGAPN